MLHRTLYKTATPETSVHDAEYYEMIVKAVGNEYIVIETYGWWDDERKEIVNRVDTLKPETGEGYPTFEDAAERFNQQVHLRAKSGFVHGFSIEFPTGKKIYELIEP